MSHGTLLRVVPHPGVAPASGYHADTRWRQRTRFRRGLGGLRLLGVRNPAPHHPRISAVIRLGWPYPVHEDCPVTAAGTTGLRTVRDHPWVGKRVVDPATGRSGRVGLIVEHVARDRRYGPDPGPARVVWREAHVRPDDGSGIEWQANLDALQRAIDRQPPAEPGREQ